MKKIVTVAVAITCAAALFTACSGSKGSKAGGASDKAVGYTIGEGVTFHSEEKETYSRIKKGTEKILSANTEALEIPETAALIAAVVSIIVKEAMFQYTRLAAKKINSGALMADAWHHRSDALSSIGAFIGIFGAMLGFPVLDPLASVIICIFIELC